MGRRFCGAEIESMMLSLSHFLCYEHRPTWTFSPRHLFCYVSQHQQVNTCTGRLTCRLSIREVRFGQGFLNRNRPSSRLGPPFGVLFARRALPCSPLPTLPRAASAVLASSPGDGCCFRFLVINTIPFLIPVVSIRTYRCVSIWRESGKNPGG